MTGGRLRVVRHVTPGWSTRLLIASLALGGCRDPDGRAADSGLTGLDAGGPVTDAPGLATNVPGRHDLEFELEGHVRHALVYVPESAGDVAAPVVVMLHGTSQDGEMFFADGHWIPEADANGIIIVYPDSLSYCFHRDENGDGDFADPGELRVNSKWNSGILGGADHPLCTATEIAALAPGTRALVDHPLRDDVAFLDRLLERLERTFVVDSRRVYATGFSNGGEMASRLAVERSTRYAAVAAHAGFLEIAPRASERPISMALSIGSADDNFVPGPESIPLDETALSSPYFVDLQADYLAIAQLEPTYTHETAIVGPRTLSRFVWATSTVGADNRVELAVIEGVTHTYPPMEAQLWAFFSGYSLP